MKKQLTTEEKQQVLLDVLRENDDGFAVFGIPKEIAKPLIDRGLIDKNVYKYIGGCKLTKKGRL